MTADSGGAFSSGVPQADKTLIVPEIRDYQQINKELSYILGSGHRRVHLVGVDGQRLLLYGLRGDWNAVVEVHGKAGPELAAGSEAPNLVVVCRGDALDGVGSGLVAGTVVVEGSAGTAAGYAQRGGLIVVKGEAGPRAGLNQSGGVLILQSRVGPLAGERQSGGYTFRVANQLASFAGHGRRGGRFIALGAGQEPSPDDLAVYEHAIAQSTSLL